MELIITLFL